MRSPMKQILLTSCLIFFGSKTALATPLTVSYQSPGQLTYTDFAGISIEKNFIFDGNNFNTSSFFDYQNTSLVNLFKKIGVKHLRVGGNTADNYGQYTPTTNDERRILNFAWAAGIPTLTYTLGMQGNYYPPGRASEANILQSYNNSFSPVRIPNLNFELDNEPDKVYTWATYYDHMTYYVNNMETLMGTNFQIVGADPASNQFWVGYMANLTSDSNFSSYLDYTTAHYYPGGNAFDANSCYLNRILDDATTEQTYDLFIAHRSAGIYPTGPGLRISETNSCYNGGRAGVSDTYASALWLLDYMHYMGFNGIQGVNLHWTNPYNSGVTNPKYNPIYPSDYTTSGYVATPVVHGMKAYTFFDPGVGRYFNLTFTGNTDPNVKVYAYHDSNNYLNLIMINRSLASTNSVTINKNSFSTPYGNYGTYTHAQATWLVADSVDATQDVNNPNQMNFGFEKPDASTGSPDDTTRATLNHNTIAKGSFPGTNNSSFTISLPPYSALMLQLTP